MTQSFDEWFKDHEKEVFKNNQGCFDGGYKLGSKMGFNAGAQSRQAEIDNLKQALNSALQATKNVCVERDEMQKRIDDALKHIEPSDEMSHKLYRDINKILKGEE